MPPVTTRDISEYLRANPAASMDDLSVQFPAADVWTLRNLRREALREQSFAAMTPEAVIASTAMEGLSAPAKAALRAGFFRPVQITYTEQRPIKPLFRKAGYEYLVMSDVHAPDQDDDAIDVTVQVGQALDVDELIIAGDFFDVHSLSKYTPSADRPLRWVEERQQAVPVLAGIRAAFAKKPAQCLIGNHDNRPERYISGIAPALQGLFTLPQLLGIDTLDFTFPDDNSVLIADKLQVIHGERVRKDAGASVKAEVMDSGLSTVMGHVHRRAMYELTTKAQEVRGEQPLLGVELGCLCKLRPEYLAKERTANWQHGAAIVTVYDGGLVDVEPIRIHQGRAFFRGRLFESRVRASL